MFMKEEDAEKFIAVILSQKWFIFIIKNQIIHLFNQNEQ